MVDQRLIQPIDAVDTGTQLIIDPTSLYPGVQPCSLSYVISLLNRPWDVDIRRITCFMRQSGSYPTSCYKQFSTAKLN